MDYTLVALFGVIALAVVISTRYHSRTWSGRPGYQYQRVISVGFLGLFLTTTGAIGWDVSRMREFVRGTKWADGPVWSQLGLGLVLLAFAAFLALRVPANASRSPVR